MKPPPPGGEATIGCKGFGVNSLVKNPPPPAGGAEGAGGGGGKKEKLFSPAGGADGGGPETSGSAGCSLGSSSPSFGLFPCSLGRSISLMVVGSVLVALVAVITKYPPIIPIATTPAAIPIAAPVLIPLAGGGGGGVEGGEEGGEEVGEEGGASVGGKAGAGVLSGGLISEKGGVGSTEQMKHDALEYVVSGAAHEMQLPVPIACLYEPFAHAVHVPPSGPEYPQLQWQEASVVLPFSDVAPDGHSEHGASPGLPFQVPAGHILHGFPFSPE